MRRRRGRGSSKWGEGVSLRDFNSNLRVGRRGRWRRGRQGRGRVGWEVGGEKMLTYFGGLGNTFAEYLDFYIAESSMECD